MRRIVLLLCCLFLIAALSVTGSAASKASSGEFSATIAQNGSCQVMLYLQLHLDNAASDLTLPVPANARGVQLNGSSARTSRSGDLLLVNLNRLLGNATGDFSVRLQYTLPNVVGYNDQDILELSLPMLSGFDYPVEDLHFTVIFPSIIETSPRFFSGYYQQSIESDIVYTVEGNQIEGTVQAKLKDRETLTMTLMVDETVFPQNTGIKWSVGNEGTIMGVLAGAALLYWLVFMRCAPLRRIRSFMSPQGYTAGQLTSALTGRGGDLTMMVLSWAQMGYILIHLQENGRVTLHKRMEMGNERSNYEIHVFKDLFGKRRSVDGTGYHYALLCRKVAAKAGDVKDLYQRRNGNPRIFRGICALMGAFGGLVVGVAVAADAVLGILVVAVLVILGGISAWFMQIWARGLHLRDNWSLYIGLGIAGLWLLLGLFTGQSAITLGVIAAQLLGGLMLTYGGRRTPLGRQTASQILGLRHYLHSLPKEELQHITRYDPEFFFSMAPYAIALGVGKSFARRFGRKRLSGCTYLTTGMDGHMNAYEWCLVMEQAVNALDTRQKRLPIERLMGR